jgi:dihydrofolate reductase
MRASVFVGTSLDGFLARPDGSFDFLSPGGVEPEPHGFDEFLATVDALVMGRNTFDVVLPFPTWPYGQKPVFVLTSRPLPSAPEGAIVERMSGTPSEVLSQLASRGFHHVYVDGGATIQAFLRAGLIQRLVVSRVPVLIGAGIALFGAVDADIPLRLIATRQFPSGLVQSEYAIGPGPPSQAASPPVRATP